MTPDSLPPPSALVPHQGDVLLIDRIIRHDDESTVAGVSVRKQQWLTQEDGSAPPWTALEYMAQCIALHEGIRAHLENLPPARGLLAAVTGLDLYCVRFGRSAALRVHARRVRGRPGLGAVSYACAIYVDIDHGDGRLLAEGRLSMSVPRGTSRSD
jgi:predicted hotdog family 3-hydroxylacyl-ACP dehydratase